MTSIRHRLLVDECLPPKLVSIYLDNHSKVSGSGVEVVHIQNHLGKGKKDPLWVPIIAKDQRWCVLSVDKGSHSTNLDALPIVCAELEVTLFRITDPLRKLGLTFYGPQILAKWHYFMQGMEGPKGAQYLLKVNSANHDNTDFLATAAIKGYRIDKGQLVPEPARTRKPLKIHEGERKPRSAGPA